MSHANWIRAAAWTASLFLLAAAAAAQMPAATEYVVASHKTNSPALAAIDAAGKVTSLVPLAGATAPVSIAMSVRNSQLVVWDHGQLHHYDVATGARTRTTLAAFNRVAAGIVDEDGGMVWCTDAGSILKSTDFGCTKMLTVATLANYSFQALGREGSSGRWLLSGYDGITNDWRILYFDVNGWVIQSIVGMPSVTGLSWSPWSNCTYGSYDSNGGGVICIDGWGVASTLSLPASAACANLVGLEVRNQPSEQILCVEGGATPQHLVLIAPGGSVTTVHSSSGVIDPVDVTVLRGRSLWGASPWSLGKTGLLSLDFGPTQAGKSYQIALSYRCRPGLQVPGVGTIHLVPDSMFYLSIVGGPPVFNGFSGVLNAQGRVLMDPYVQIPSNFDLLGIRVYGAAVAFDTKGITAISNAWAINIGWT